mgnify:CR=1 FL=1
MPCSFFYAQTCNALAVISRRQAVSHGGTHSALLRSALLPSPASSLSRELVSGRHLPLSEAVGWPRPPWLTACRLHLVIAFFFLWCLDGGYNAELHPEFMSEANVFYTTIKNVNYPSKDEIRGVKVGSKVVSKVGSSDAHPVDIYVTSKRLSREDLINRIPSGRGHACFWRN